MNRYVGVVGAARKRNEILARFRTVRCVELKSNLTLQENMLVSVEIVALECLTAVFVEHASNATTVTPMVVGLLAHAATARSIFLVGSIFDLP